MIEEEDLRLRQQRELKEIDKVVQLVQQRAEKLKDQVINNPKSIMKYARAFNKFWNTFNYKKLRK